jgi:hypothetical protein
MQMLVQQIEEMIQTQKCCFVRPDELRRVWSSVRDDQREQIVREFAHEHGWRIFSYNAVLGAMFVRHNVPGNEKVPSQI